MTVGSRLVSQKLRESNDYSWHSACSLPAVHERIPKTPTARVPVNINTVIRAATGFACLAHLLLATCGSAQDRIQPARDRIEPSQHPRQPRQSSGDPYPIPELQLYVYATEAHLQLNGDRLMPLTVAVGAAPWSMPVPRDTRVEIVCTVDGHRYRGVVPPLDGVNSLLPLHVPAVRARTRVDVRCTGTARASGQQTSQRAILVDDVAGSIWIEPPVYRDLVFSTEAPHPQRDYRGESPRYYSPRACDSGAAPSDAADTCVGAWVVDRNRPDALTTIMHDATQHSVTCHLDAQLVQQQRTLRSGGTGSLAPYEWILGRLTPGEHVLRCAITTPWPALESDTTNNSLELSFNVLERRAWTADLAIASISRRATAPPPSNLPQGSTPQPTITHIAEIQLSASGVFPVMARLACTIAESAREESHIETFVEPRAAVVRIPVWWSQPWGTAIAPPPTVSITCTVDSGESGPSDPDPTNNTRSATVIIPSA